MTATFFVYTPVETASLLEKFSAKTGLEALQHTDCLGHQIAYFAAPESDFEALRAQAHALNLDFSPLNLSATASQPGLVVMDMDSTAIQIECIDEIAKLAGTGELVSEITERAMRGELDFEQSLRQRVGTLKGADESILAAVREKLPLMGGLEAMISTLQQAGWQIAIASGGFTYFADTLKARFNLLEAVSNQLEICDGKLTGEVLGRVIDAQFKADTLKRLATSLNLPHAQWVAIGDGANDLPMIHAAGLGVAFHAKPKVQAQAQVMINFTDLRGLVVLLSAQTLYNAR